jgi:hypothetical protein
LCAALTKIAAVLSRDARDERPLDVGVSHCSKCGLWCGFVLRRQTQIVTKTFVIHSSRIEVK